ncbi:MAG: stage II sporulation protein M [Ignavibacteriales bacterium]|nr:stage II sporulation protein M [Ignavibacteriales bacterium]
MKEVQFIKNNSERWREVELFLSKKTSFKDPDKLAELFIQLTDDLSYSKTFYSQSKTTQYLNSLTSKVHQSVYKNKKEKGSRIISFWKYELPEIFYARRKELLISFIIFFVAVVIGIVSSAGDTGFVRLILGDSYVNMTLENIDQGDPLAVYKKMNGVDMFMGITFNNIRVSFYTFMSGLLLSVGTVMLLLYNGIMLGTFHHFFFERNLLFKSLSIIWIHGTIEISSIIIAGAAGLILGNSILFPKTYSRRQSFLIAAKDGVKIIIGLIPLFIIAGFLESFVTRYTKMQVFINLTIIISSLSFIIWYVVIYPTKLSRREVNESKEN